MSSHGDGYEMKQDVDMCQVKTTAKELSIQISTFEYKSSRSELWSQDVARVEFLVDRVYTGHFVHQNMGVVDVMTKVASRIDASLRFQVRKWFTWDRCNWAYYFFWKPPEP